MKLSTTQNQPGFDVAAKRQDLDLRLERGEVTDRRHAELMCNMMAEQVFLNPDGRSFVPPQFLFAAD